MTTDGLGRRAFLGGGLAAASAAALTGGRVRSDTTAPGLHGLHQPGIVDPAPRALTVATFTVTAVDRTALIDALRTLTERVRFLVEGGNGAVVARDLPPDDSGVLGPTIAARRISVTVAVGASLFDERFGLADRVPKHLTFMPSFPNDQLADDMAHGDLLVQLGAEDQLACHHALRDIARHVRGALTIAWKIDGFTSGRENGRDATPRNLLGFKDGTSNPVRDDASRADALVWAAADEPAWCRGGTYMVVRVIRMFVEFWDRVSLREQERMIGRRRASGATLDRDREHDAPDYDADPMGVVVPLDAHIRLANPRTAETADNQMVRRGFSYDNGLDAAGNLDVGLVFVCFQQDIARQFATVQERLNGEPLEDYIRPVGGGYFFALPGLAGPGDWYGRTLFA